MNSYEPDIRRRALSIARGISARPSLAQARQLLEEADERERQEALDGGARRVVAEFEAREHQAEVLGR